jgi:hypothetical protein
MHKEIVRVLHFREAIENLLMFSHLLLLISPCDIFIKASSLPSRTKCESNVRHRKNKKLTQ